jgi:hypothetical protein
MQVGVKNLKVVGNEGWTLIHEGEAEKQVCVYIILFYINNTNSLFTIFSLGSLYSFGFLVWWVSFGLYRVLFWVLIGYPLYTLYVLRGALRFLYITHYL